MIVSQKGFCWLCHLFHIHNLCHLIHYYYCNYHNNHNIVIIITFITIIITIIIIKIIIIVIFLLCTSPITVSFVSRSFWSNPSILLQLREVKLMYHMCNMIHVIAFLSSPSEFQTLCVHLASVSIVRIWYCGVSSWFWLDFLVLLTGPCPRSLPALSLLSDPPTRCHRQPSNQHSQSASNQENCSSSSSSLTEDANACLDKQLVDDIELLANGFHDQRIDRACCHALHAATATVGERSCLFIGCFCFSWWSNLAAPSCHLLQLTPSRELMSTVFAARPGDRFSKDSKACNCNHRYSLILDPILPTLIAAKQSFVILAVDFFCSPSSHSMSFNLWLPMWLPSSPCGGLWLKNFFFSNE